MGIESFFAIVIMVTLAIISATLILLSVGGTLLHYRSLKKQGITFDLNTNMLFFTVYIPLVYLSVLGFTLYMF